MLLVNIFRPPTFKAKIFSNQKILHRVSPHSIGQKSQMREERTTGNSGYFGNRNKIRLRRIYLGCREFYSGSHGSHTHMRQAFARRRALRAPGDQLRIGPYRPRDPAIGALGVIRRAREGLQGRAAQPTCPPSAPPRAD